jgi:cell division protein FtsB
MFSRILNKKIVTAVLIAVFGLLAASLTKVYPEADKLSREGELFQAKIDQINLESKKTEKLTEYYKSEAYLEKQAKLRFNFKRPGENVVFVYGDTYNQSPVVGDVPEKGASPMLAGVLEWFRKLFR